jgi:tetratricopeptide (TPR) repeat protein
MKKTIVMVMVLGMVLAVAGCGEKQDPNVRRGDLFLKNKKFAAAIKSYEMAVKNNPALMQDDAFKMHFKDAYYYKGGQIELSADNDPDILAAAYKYYVKGFDVWPKEVGICDKLTKYYWDQKDFATAAKYLRHMVEFDGAMPDTDKHKWLNLHNDYYSLGYALYQTKNYKEAREALEQSLKADKKGPKAAQAKSALAAIQQKLK